MGAAGKWVSPETTKPYPGQQVLACYKVSASPSGKVGYAYALVTYETHDRWFTPDEVLEAPFLWAAIMRPGL